MVEAKLPPHFERYLSDIFDIEENNEEQWRENK